MASNHTDSLKQRALIRALPRTGGSLPSLEQDWLQDELGLDSPKHLKRMWKDYLIALGVTSTSLNGMMKNWLEAAGYSGSLYSMIRDYWADREALLFSVLSPRASGEISIEPLNGEGSATFTRTTVAHVRDFENVYRQVASGEARIQGARRVENLCLQSNTLATSPWSDSIAGTGLSPVITNNFGTAPDGATTASRLQLDLDGGTTTGDISQRRQTVTVVGEAVYSVWLKSNTAGTFVVSVIRPDGNFDNVTVTTTWQRFTTKATQTAGTSMGIRLRGGQGTSDSCDILVWGSQHENVSGASDETLPNELQTTTTVAVAKNYWRTNGNSVSSNVVTEADGINLHPISLDEVGYVGFDRYATRADSTAYVVGDRVITGAAPSDSSGELVTNGALTTDVSWSKQTGWDINSTTAAKAHCDGSQTGASSLYQAAVMVDNAKHILSYTISGYSAGNIKIFAGGGSSGTLRSADGTYHEILTHDGGADVTLYLQADVDFIGDIDDVSVVTVHNTNDGTAGGNGYRYRCTTAGTTAASEGTFDETIGNSTTDGTAVFINEGHAKIAGYLGEPASTNSILQSREFGTTWVPSGTPPTLTQDQDGIDGVANTAWTIDDTSSSFEDIDQAVSIPNDSNTHCLSLYILKDSDTTRFPGIHLSLAGGTTQEIRTHVNTQTGALVDEVSTGTVSSSIEDHGLWWRLVLLVKNNTTGNGTATARIYPAMATVQGTNSSAAQGSIIADQAQLELNTSVPSSPIVTTTVAVTRNVDALTYAASGNLVDAQGTMLCSMIAYDEAEAASGRIIADDTANLVVAFVSSFSKISAYDGTTSAALGALPLTEKESANISTRWETGTSKMQVTTLGTSGAETAYDGAWGFTNIKLLGGSSASYSFQGTISDIRIYNKDLGTTVCESLTSTD